MKINKNYILIFILFFILPKAKSAETIFLYKGTFSRTLKIEELYKFKQSKIPSNKLKRLLKITNQNEKDFHKLLTHEIEIPLKTSSKLMNSKIGEVFLTRITKVIHPNKIFNKETGIKALRSGIILSSFKNDQKANLLDFLKEYPNKNIAINLNALGKTLKKVESLKELIEFYSNSPFKKLKDGSSNT
tara:strand:- start:288 stop:851 length:564 start_codon:yes stop_codon:yes gene_type:complete